ncbi:hypothetical protein RV134_230091 [Roseovarius sp. EC-HK134]|nr:hypothetical protein RV134_230091 [Roseovarius sp. EC-HK134]
MVNRKSKIINWYGGAVAIFWSARYHDEAEAVKGRTNAPPYSCFPVRGRGVCPVRL